MESTEKDLWLIDAASASDQSGSQPTITYAIPCFNSAEYMDKCIESLLATRGDKDDIEILIVDDGSVKDSTAEKADQWEQQYPGIIRALHKPNGGHGSAVNMGMRNARGIYFKVVDSDDWLDRAAMEPIMKYLRSQRDVQDRTDLVIGNYVYEKVHENQRTIMHYRNVFPEGRRFTWDECGHFSQSQYLLMHSVIYRTSMLRSINLTLPEHCFYVDNVFVYVPLPHVQSLYYLDVDMYRYFIGREDQSVNESVMMGRIDQQLRVTRTLIDAVQLPADVPIHKLERYMENYLSMMMCICSIFLRMIDTDEAEDKREDIWQYLKEHNPEVYRRVRRSVLNASTNLPTELGRRLGITGYRLAQRIFKFN